MTPYLKLKRASDKFYKNQTSINQSNVFKVAIQLLQDENIKLRPNAQLVQKNFSIPQSITDCIVIGLRYQKEDMTFTEDHYLFEDGIDYIQKGNGKKKWLEKKLKEYSGAHKLQIVE